MVLPSRPPLLVLADPIEAGLIGHSPSGLSPGVSDIEGLGPSTAFASGEIPIAISSSIFACISSILVCRHTL